MANTQTIRRTARHTMQKSRGGKNAFGYILKGLGAAVLLTLALVTLFAFIVGVTDAADKVIRLINQLIKLSAVILGAYVAVPKGTPSGITRGAVLGALYMAAGVGVYALCTHQQLTFLQYLTDVLMGIAAGGLAGMLFSSRQAQ